MELLDEVGELPLETQAKLLRVVQEREFERVGGTRALRVDVRVIAATNRDLQAEVAAGRFRADLYFRLNVFPITVPPLRERRDDIPRLLRHAAARIARRLGREVAGIAPAFIDAARAYDWPGNVRELENVVERALIVSRGGPLDASAALAQGAAQPTGSRVASSVEAQAGAASAAPAVVLLDEMTREHIRHALDAAQGRIEGKSGAAHRLGLNPSTLRGRMRKLGIGR